MTTALEKFLKQIILKQDKGSIYLVPAICDFQIENALKEEKNQTKSYSEKDMDNAYDKGWEDATKKVKI